MEASGELQLNTKPQPFEPDPSPFHYAVLVVSVLSFGLRERFTKFRHTGAAGGSHGNELDRPIYVLSSRSLCKTVLSK